MLILCCINKQKKLNFVTPILFITALVFASFTASQGASAHFLGGKFSHTPGQTRTLYWHYYGNHRYLGNAFQAGENWRNGAARINPQRKVSDTGVMHMRLYDTWEPSQTYWAYAVEFPCPACTPYSNTEIHFNPPMIDPESDFTRTQIATHEFGHTLGLAHAPYNANYHSVMKNGRHWYNTPMPHDKQDINSLYH